MITKAIIPVAGWGTRRLPITKAVEKCMLPIGNRPVVDYVVEDCLRAGITDVYFVVSPGSTQLKAYYSENKELNDYLIANGKENYLADITPPTSIRFHYVIQNTNDRYGTAIPIALTESYLEDDESVVVLMGDDLIYSKDGSSEVKRLIEAAGDDSAMLGVEIAKENVGRYGVLQLDTDNNFVHIVEKPQPAEAPSTLINVSKYVLNAAAISKIVEYSHTDQTGEYYITDPINDYVKDGGKMRVVQAKGDYLDSGNLDGWLHANNVVCSNN